MSVSRRDDDWPSELRLDDAAGPAPHLGQAATDAIVRDVLAGAGLGAPRRRWGARSVAAAVLLACVGGGSASAAVLWYVRARREAEAPVSQPARPGSAQRPTQRAGAQLAPVAEPAPTAEGAPPDATPTRRATRAPEDWLREGNRLRSARRWKQADEAYGQAAARGSNPELAYVARVASAGLRLEHLRDARGALARYRAALALAPGGALDEEVRLGIADAYRALGDREREQRALQAFLAHHPSSALAERARERLE